MSESIEVRPCRKCCGTGKVHRSAATTIAPETCGQCYGGGVEVARFVALDDLIRDAKALADVLRPRHGP